MNLEEDNTRELNKNIPLSLKESQYFFFIAHPTTKNKSTVYKYERKQREYIEQGFIKKKHNQSVKFRFFWACFCHFNICYFAGF